MVKCLFCNRALNNIPDSKKLYCDNIYRVCKINTLYVSNNDYTITNLNINGVLIEYNTMQNESSIKIEDKEYKCKFIAYDNFLVEINKILDNLIFE